MSIFSLLLIILFLLIENWLTYICFWKIKTFAVSSMFLSFFNFFLSIFFFFEFGLHDQLFDWFHFFHPKEFYDDDSKNCYDNYFNYQHPYSFTYVLPHTYVLTHTHIHTYIYTYIHTYIHTHTHTNTHIHTYTQSQTH